MSGACAPGCPRRDQLELPVPLETQHTNRSTARQEECALTRRRDTAERAHSAVTIRGLVHDWLDAEGPDGLPRKSWVKELLRGKRLSYKKPAKCVKDFHSTEQQHANTHRLFIKLCWLMDTHAVSADRVVNTDEDVLRPFAGASDRVRAAGDSISPTTGASWSVKRRAGGQRLMWKIGQQRLRQLLRTRHSVCS